MQTIWLACLVSLVAGKSSENPYRAKTPDLFQLMREYGTYTISHQAADGSYQSESRDINGHITGKYGYIGNDGGRKEIHYSVRDPTFVTQKESQRKQVMMPSKVPIQNQAQQLT